MVVETLRDFCQSTSVHGLAYVVESKSSLLKRLTWMAIFLTCLSFAIVQIQESINGRLRKYRVFQTKENIKYNFPYSHLSNKFGAQAYRFWKIPPSTKNIHGYWFFRFYPTSTPHLLELCISFFHKIPPSTFIPSSSFNDFTTFAHHPRLFHPSFLIP